MLEIDYSDDDEIMAELRRIRAEMYDRFGEDSEKFLAHLAEVEKRDRARGGVYVDLRQRRHRHEPDAA